MRGIRAGSRVLPTPRSLRVPSLRLPYRLLRGFICGPTGWASHAADAGVANVLTCVSEAFECQSTDACSGTGEQGSIVGLSLCVPLATGQVATTGFLACSRVLFRT